MTIDWNQIVKDVEAQVLALAEKIFEEYSKEASLDAKNFLENSADKLKRWTTMVASAIIDKEEFQSLVKGQLDVAEFHALKQTGLVQVRIDMFKNGLVTIVTTAVLGAIKGIME